MSASMLNRIKELEPLVDAHSGVITESVYGIVDRINKDGTPHCIRKWKGTIGNMRPTKEKPTIHIIEKLEPLILKHKKYKCIYGGRAGTKSICAMDVMSGDVNSCGSPCSSNSWLLTVCPSATLTVRRPACTPPVRSVVTVSGLIVCWSLPSRNTL